VLHIYIYIYIYDISSLRVKRQAIKLRDCSIWLVDLFEYMMMHGLTNPKFISVFFFVFVLFCLFV